MTNGERESIIAQLALIEGVNQSVFKKYTDEQLEKEMQLIYGESTND